MFFPTIVIVMSFGVKRGQDRCTQQSVVISRWMSKKLCRRSSGSKGGSRAYDFPNAADLL